VGIESIGGRKAGCYVYGRTSVAGRPDARVDAWLVAQAWSDVGVGWWQSLPARHAISLISLLVWRRRSRYGKRNKYTNYVIYMNMVIQLFSCHHLGEKNVGLSLFHVALVHRRQPALP
jgi:hypothetical protein